MKWTPEQLGELKTLCFDEKSNAEIAEHFGVPVTEIHAKRSQLGVTIPKIRAMKSASAPSPAIVTAPENTESMGLETFSNDGETCIVLARLGKTALIVMPNKTMARFVVPLEHVPGAHHWWQGHYFDDLDGAYTYYKSITQEEE